MSQGSEHIDLPSSLGYLLKEAATALRHSMEATLRPMGMTITHYSCLELLAQRPGLSNSELARGTFVTRQSMNVLLQTLEREGLVTRNSTPPVGRVLPTQITERGRTQLAAASTAVKLIEDSMLAALSEPERDQARRLLETMIGSLSDDPC